MARHIALAQEASAGQIEAAWRNVLAVLAEAGMGPLDLVKVTAYLTRAEDVATYREVRERMIPGVEPASTLVVVRGLASPEWLVEIEAVAAAAAGAGVGNGPLAPAAPEGV